MNILLTRNSRNRFCSVFGSKSMWQTLHVDNWTVDRNAVRKTGNSCWKQQAPCPITNPPACNHRYLHLFIDPLRLISTTGPLRGQVNLIIALWWTVHGVLCLRLVFFGFTGFCEASDFLNTSGNILLLKQTNS